MRLDYLFIYFYLVVLLIALFVSFSMHLGLRSARPLRAGHIILGVCHWQPRGHRLAWRLGHL